MEKNSTSVIGMPSSTFFRELPTGLANRRYLDEYIEVEWNRALRDNTEMSLLMIDVDYFKAYNDQHGHVAGDEVLRRVGDAIRTSCTRAADLAARYGGEEFAVVMPGTSAGGARLQAEKLRRAIEALGIPNELPTPGSRMSVSIGIATLKPSAEMDPLSIVVKADEGLYLAKHSGRNQVGMVADS
jgi:two-component system chemotaxis family response regulator WspR